MVTHRDGECGGGGCRGDLGRDGASAVQVARHHHPVHNQAHCHDEGDDGEEEEAGHGADCLAGHLDACYGYLHAHTSQLNLIRYLQCLRGQLGPSRQKISSVASKNAEPRSVEAILCHMLPCAVAACPAQRFWHSSIESLTSSMLLEDSGSSHDWTGPLIMHMQPDIVFGFSLN